MGFKNHSLGLLREMCPGRLISLRGDVGWPARSPDLSPCDFFLWGYLKKKVFKHRPRSLEDLKGRIREETDAIPPEINRRVIFIIIIKTSAWSITESNTVIPRLTSDPANDFFG